MDYFNISNTFSSETKIMNRQRYNTCIIETILSHRQSETGRYEFLIKWKRGTPTWVPLENLETVIDLVQKYIDQAERIDYEKWGKPINSQQSQKNQNILIQQMDIEDQDTRESFIQKPSKKQFNEKQKKQNQPYLLQFDELFPSSPVLPQQRYKSKFTKIEEEKPSQNDQIQWKSITKATDIMFDQSSQKWMVNVEFYQGPKESQWVQREILRLVNPFVLLDLYARQQRKLIESQSVQQIQQKEKSLEEIPKNLSSARYQKNKHMYVRQCKQIPDQNLIQIDSD